MASPARHRTDPPTGPININPWVSTEQIPAQQQLSTDPSLPRPTQYTTGPVPVQTQEPEPEPRPRRRHAAEPDDPHEHNAVGSLGWVHVALAVVVGVVLVCITIALAGDPTGAAALAFFAMIVGSLFAIGGSVVSMVRRKQRR